MTAADVVVTLGGIGLIALLACYFFAPLKATRAQVEGGRQENSDCTDRVVFPDFRKSISLAAFGTTTVDLDVQEPGEFSWACAPEQGGDEVVEAARGVTTENRGTARAVGAGPHHPAEQRDPLPARAETGGTR